MANLAYRFREDTARNYESYITSLLAGWPDVLVCSPACSVETFSCRLRDAIRSFRENRWRPRHFALADLDAIGDVVVAIRGSNVVVGTKEALLAWDTVRDTTTLMDAKTTKPPGSPVHIIENPSQSALEALMRLHHERILTTPSHVHVDKSEDFGDVDYWQHNYDVSIETMGNGNYRIL